MEHKRDFKTLLGFVLLCVSVGMGMGTAKTHIYEAIDDYKQFKSNSTEFELEMLERVEALELSASAKASQIKFVNDKMNKIISGE